MTAGVKTCEIKAKGNPPKALATPATQPCPPCYRVMITLLIVPFPPAVVSETMVPSCYCETGRTDKEVIRFALMIHVSDFTCEKLFKGKKERKKKKKRPPSLQSL